MWWGYPFGGAVGVFSGGPAVVEEAVMRCAGEGEVVDVSATAGGPFADVVGLAQVSRGGAVGVGVAAVFGKTASVVHRCSRSLPVQIIGAQSSADRVVPNGGDHGVADATPVRLAQR
ncbi:hypothetical protein BKG85_11770 [Mycobacteroides chelonae]|nr:hypothetical protein BKG85_11770 [Mycobacteroides chelonae]